MKQVPIVNKQLKKQNGQNTAAPVKNYQNPILLNDWDTLQNISEMEKRICNGSSAVLLLVDPGVAPGIRTRLSQFEGDLCSEGMTVIEKVCQFSNPPELRRHLQNLYDREPRLKGAILIGNFPHAYQRVTSYSSNPMFPPATEKVISLQFYSDLDGIFSTSGALPPFLYDRHEGLTDWEIWIGLLPLYKGDYPRTIEAMNQYFVKNHEYRHPSGKPLNARETVFSIISEHYIAHNAEESGFFSAALRTGGTHGHL